MSNNVTLALEVRRLRWLVTIQTFVLILDGFLVLYVMKMLFLGGM